MKHIFFSLAITVFSFGHGMAQKIEKDETDKKNKQRFIQVSDKKIPISDLSITPDNSAKLGTIKSLSFNMLALADTKYLHLALTNTKQLTSFDIVSITAADSTGGQYPLVMQEVSAIGKKRNMTSQGNETLYDNDFYLSGDLNKLFSKIVVVLKDDSTIEISLQKEEQSFLRRSNLIISNSLGHY